MYSYICYLDIPFTQLAAHWWLFRMLEVIISTSSSFKSISNLQKMSWNGLQALMMAARVELQRLCEQRCFVRQPAMIGNLGCVRSKTSLVAQETSRRLSGTWADVNVDHTYVTKSMGLVIILYHYNVCTVYTCVFENICQSTIIVLRLLVSNGPNSETTEEPWQSTDDALTQNTTTYYKYLVSFKAFFWRTEVSLEHSPIKRIHQSKG